MKNYSSKKAKKGKLAYRTPSRFIYSELKAQYIGRRTARYKQYQEVAKRKTEKNKKH